MKIDFPCPASPKELIPTEAGSYCTHCSKEVINIDGMSADEVMDLMREEGSLCVSTSNAQAINRGYSLRKFALSLLIVFGGSLFTSLSAQVESTISSIAIEKPQAASIGILQVSFVDQHDNVLSTSVDVQIELPNGKIIEPTLSDDDFYYIELPAYVKGKSVTIIARRGDKKKVRTIYVSGLAQDLSEEIKFKTKKIKYTGRFMGCPSF